MDFFTRHLTHTKGKWAGARFELEPWQEQEVIRPLFGTLLPDGLRQYRTCYVETGRKNGKSTVAAGIALKLLFADGEPGGEIYGAAADRDQASIVFGMAAQMVRNSRVLSDRAKIIDSTKRIIVTKGVSAGSVYRAIPADVGTSWGFNASGIIFDELHAQPNRELWDALTTATGARTQPLIFAITTAGYDRQSICWEQHEYARQVLEGVIDDPAFLAVIYAADEQDDWTNPVTWRKANPNFGITISADYFERECAKAVQVPGYQNSFRRLHLSQWTAQASRWMDMGRWDECEGELSERRLEGKVCYAGLDLSATTALTALCLVFPPEDPDEGDYQAVMRFWTPEENLVERGRRDRVPYQSWVDRGLIEATPGSVIDYAAIEREILKLALRFRLRQLAVDRLFNSEYLAQRVGEQHGIEIIRMGQGYLSMSYPTKELMRLVLQRRLVHGGNPVLRWNVDNVVVEQDSAGNLKPSRQRSTQRIDGVIALVEGLDLALRHQPDYDLLESVR